MTDESRLELRYIVYGTSTMPLFTITTPRLVSRGASLIVYVALYWVVNSVIWPHVFVSEAETVNLPSVMMGTPTAGGAFQKTSP